MEPRLLLRQMFDAAIASAQPALCIPPHLPEAPRGRLIVIGAGKASAAMARAVERGAIRRVETIGETRAPSRGQPMRDPGTRGVEAALVKPAAADHRVARKEFLLGRDLRDPERHQQRLP